MYTYMNTVSSHKFNSQHLNLRVSNPRTIAYAYCKLPCDSSNLPRAEPISSDCTFESYCRYYFANTSLLILLHKYITVLYKHRTNIVLTIITIILIIIMSPLLLLIIIMIIKTIIHMID